MVTELFYKNFPKSLYIGRMGTIRAGLKPMQPMQLHWVPRHGVWVDCSFLPDTPCAWEISRNAIYISLLTKNALVRTSEFPLERYQRCSILVLVFYCISALYLDRNTVDWTWWRHKIIAQRGPAPRSCIGPRIC